MRLFSKSKTKIYKGKIHKNKFKIKIEFSEAKNKKSRKVIIGDISDTFNKRIIVKKQNKDSLTILVKTVNPYFPMTVHDVNNDLLYIAERNKFSFRVYDNKELNMSEYEWKRKEYRVYFTQSRTEEHYAWVTAISEEEARDKFYDGDYSDSEYLDTVYVGNMEINDVEESW
jgi:hypothetical protein